MSKKVIRTMIYLVMVFLVGLYVVKIFLPEQFVMAISNPVIVKVGNFITSNWWLDEICAFIASFITYWLYLGAILHRWTLNWKQILVSFVTIAATHLLYELDPTIASSFSIIAMIALPAMFKGNSREIAVCFSIHSIAQALSIRIRNLPFLLTDVNSIIIILMSIECYFWLLLLYLFFNYRDIKGDSKMGKYVPPYYFKKEGVAESKIAKIDAKIQKINKKRDAEIKKLNDERHVYEDIIAKRAAKEEVSKE